MVKHTKNSGYTLIEILIGLTVLSIVFTVGFAGFRAFSQRQLVAGVTKGILSDLRLIQQNATTGEKPAGTTCTKLNGYAFVYVDNDQYDLRADCTNNGNILVKAVTLPTGLTISVTTNRTLFNVLGLGTNLTSANTVTITQTASGGSSSITIGTGGDIK
jgi:prepilin-type N-terminal cleavage/methylation domain-containing protein